MVPPEVLNAALEGDLDAIENWLGEGGNPNAALEYIESDDDFASLDDDLPSTLLMAAASKGQIDVLRLLVAHDADVNVRAGGWTALIRAVESCRADCVEYLLARGADTSGIVDGTRIISGIDIDDWLDSPRIVQMLLAAGVDLTIVRVEGKSLEEHAKKEAAFYRKQYNSWGGRQTNLDAANHYDELASILAGARLKEYIPLLRLRSLLARGRARHGPETTVVAARLFGSLNGFAGLPGECFWLVVKYAWLGD